MRPAAAADVSLGRSVGGLFAAAGVAFVAMIVWLIIAGVTGYELGVLAWGMGGVIGLAAGLIARNPSPVYCGSVAGLALLSVVGAKIVMAGMLMLAGMTMNFAANMAGQFDPEVNKTYHAALDQQLADGTLTGDEKAFAEDQINQFFDGNYDGELTEEQYEVGEALKEKVHAEVAELDDAGREALLVAARRRHPEWIEDNNHYLAVVDDMVAGGRLEGELADQGRFATSSLDGKYDSEYTMNLAPAERSRRDEAVRKAATAELAALDTAARDAKVREAMARHPAWNPYPDATLAMISRMQSEGGFDAAMSDVAARRIRDEMDQEWGETDFELPDGEEIDYEARQEENRSMQAVVNEQLRELDAEARRELIAEARTDHPNWIPASASAEERLEAMKAVLTDGEDINLDGTFIGGLKAVCSPLDALWLILCGSTAFTVARKQGTPD